tara:strand:+ start:12370 stop:12975 length:606 start_codon:yes stop_codon:yes gene_type:complete
MKLKTIFGKDRIVGLAGEKQSGKTNNLISLIVDFRKKNKDVPIYVYGMPNMVMDFLKKLNVKEISSLKHLIKKRDCLLIIDEFQRLNLNDRRCKEQLNMFVDFVYHNNVYTILSSPNIREFNHNIGAVIERWLIKTVRQDMCVNGSQLKKVIAEYSGRYKELDSINIPVNKLLLINEEEEIILDCEYIKEADSKIVNKKLF